DEPVVVLDRKMNVISVNKKFLDLFRVSEDEMRDESLYSVMNGAWDIPRLRALLEKTLPKHRTFDNFQISAEFPLIGHREMLLNARQVQTEDPDIRFILLIFRDVTGKPAKKG
ncbi:MAG TPA: PAS domain-containing protein, partial [Methanoregula sp.]|nr:PAS domain-containing protein [Methanoregula sp.]